MASLIAALVAFVASAGVGIVLIPFLKKIHFGQTIKEIGPKWHKSKEGTPTMGGFMFWIGVTLGVVAGYLVLLAMSSDVIDNTLIQNTRLFAGLGLALAMGFVGFVDDYIKVVKKQNLGLRARQKTVMQFVIIILYLVTLFLVGDRSTVVTFPFIGQLDFGFFYYPLVAVGIYFIVNAVNLTDGIDGLCGSVTFVIGVAFMIICGILHYAGMGVLAAALAAGCIGFLVWNFHPAKVFMGDTGSLFLGGAVVALALGVGQPLLLIFAGFIYIAEALSVVIQVISFKTTGKRVFKMSPIHHHFEMCGWSEVKIVTVFSIVTAVGCAIAVGAACWIMR